MIPLLAYQVVNEEKFPRRKMRAAQKRSLRDRNYITTPTTLVSLRDRYPSIKILLPRFSQ